MPQYVRLSLSFSLMSVRVSVSVCGFLRDLSDPGMKTGLWPMTKGCSMLWACLHLAVCADGCVDIWLCGQMDVLTDGCIDKWMC